MNAGLSAETGAGPVPESGGPQVAHGENLPQVTVETDPFLAYEWGWQAAWNEAVAYLSKYPPRSVAGLGTTTRSAAGPEDMGGSDEAVEAVEAVEVRAPSQSPHAEAPGEWVAAGWNVAKVSEHMSDLVGRRDREEAIAEAMTRAARTHQREAEWAQSQIEHSRRVFGQARQVPNATEETS